MKRFLFLVGTVSMLLALGACTITVEPIDPIVDPEPVTANNNPFEALAVDTVSRGAPDFFEVSVPDGLAGDAIYFELETSGPATLIVYNANEEPVRVSNSPTFFTLPGELAGTALQTQAINAELTCRGPCAIVEKGSGTIFLKVETDSIEPVEYLLYAYGEQYQDTGEPANDDCSTVGAAAISPNAIIVTPDGYEGAIETIGDQDCFNSAGSVSQVTLRSDPENTDIVFRLEVYDAVTGESYGSIRVGPGNASGVVGVPNREVDIRVSSANSTAGAAAYSSYTLEF